MCKSQVHHPGEIEYKKFVLFRGLECIYEMVETNLPVIFKSCFNLVQPP